MLPWTWCFFIAREQLLRSAKPAGDNSKLGSYHTDRWHLGDLQEYPKGDGKCELGEKIVVEAGELTLIYQSLSNVLKVYAGEHKHQLASLRKIPYPGVWTLC